jgi:hypothetical protein
VSAEQSGKEPVAATEYRRAFVLPNELISVNLTGDLLVRSIKSVEAESSPEWTVVRLKISADDRGRAWFDLLLKRPVEAHPSRSASMDETPTETLPMRRAA